MSSIHNPSRAIIRAWTLVGFALLAIVLVLGVWSTDRYVRVVVLGTFALALFVASVAYLPRKRLYLSQLGSLHAWMVGHIALGALLLFAVALHGGFNETGTQGFILYGLTIAEIGSGFWGLYELKATPRRFAAFAKNDFMYPTAVRKRIEVLRGDIERTCAKREELGAWFEGRYAAALAGDGPLPELDDIPKGTKRHASGLHENAAEIVRLEVLRAKIEAVDRASRRWLWVHVPVSVAFVVFVAVHVFSWWLYG